MRAGRAGLSSVLALGAFLVSHEARAQRVLLVQPPEPDEVLSEAFNRLRAELALQGFETVLSELGPDESTPEKLSALASVAGAFAGISLSRRSGAPAAEVCIADRVTGKTSLRSLELGNARDAPSVLAVRSADLLRASLREFTSDQPPPKDVVGVDYEQPPEVVRSFAREPAARLRLQARAAALGFTQGLGPGYGPSLGFSYRAWPGVWLGVLAVGPALGATLETSVGSASVRQEVALIHLAVNVMQTGSFELAPTLSAGVYHLDAGGEVRAPLVARHAQVTSFAAGLGLESALRLSEAFTLSAELSALTLTPRPAVAVFSEQYDFPWPFFAASAGIGVEF